ncbi:hypothetical protein [Flavobacterium lacustre]|uniref:hypothetical protein n=1 Tax=Flavobacterium lacustre TaxID=3016339 RepID=UPI0022B738B9|nr:hypothetical protein [Flavobacterium lacustre]
MKNFEKVLLHTNDAQIKNELGFYLPKQKYFQEYLNKYALLCLKPLEAKDLNPLFDNPKAFLTQQITHGESLNIGGLKMNPEKLFEIIEKPVGTDELINQIITDKASQQIASQNHWFTDSFVIGNNNNLEVCQKVKQHIHEKCSLYVENEKQTEAIKLLEEISEKMTRINELKTSGNITPDDLFETLLTFKDSKFAPKLTCVNLFK